MARCAFWIAYGKDYVREAKASAASLKAHHPDLDCVLFTDGARNPSPEFTQVVQVSPRREEFWYLDSTRYFVCAFGTLSLTYDKMLYLDTDTHVCAPVDDVFRMLNKFDMVGSYAPGRETQDTVDTIPASFPELNIGVLGFRANRRVADLLDRWWIDYQANQDIYRDNDQAPLREALWFNESCVRLGILPMEFNYRFGFGNSFRGLVRVLHGRSKNIGAVCERVNAPGIRTGFKCWKQGEL